MFDVHLAEARIADVAVGIGKTELERFEDQVFCCGKVASKIPAMSYPSRMRKAIKTMIPVRWVAFR